MKKIVTQICAVVAFCMCISPAWAGGGPDIYGYYWLADTDAGGPQFDWVDITTNINAVQITGLADDNSVGPFSLGFDFHYYWSDYNQIKLGSNGWIGFDNIGNIASCYPSIPTAGGSGDNFLAPFMSDLTFTSGFPAFPNIGEMWMWTNNTDSAIITYVDVAWWKNSSGGANPPDWQGANTFQVILSAQDSSITYQYLDTDAANLYDSPGCPNDLVIGIENITGNIGLEAYNNIVPSDSSAIKFYYPNTLIFTVQDLTPAWNANSENKGQFFLVGGNVDMVTNIENTGNVDVTSPTDIDGSLTALDLTTVIWQDNATLPSLAQGANQSVTFSTQANISQSGLYYYDVDISNGNDINPSNNSNTTEISAVEVVGGVYPLTYCTQNPPDGVISWAGGNPSDGVAVFYRPPVSPAQLNSVSLWLVADGDPGTPVPHGCEIEIWSEGLNGLPDFLLATVAVPANQIDESGFTNVPIPTQPTFSGGNGFYVFWRQGGDSLAIGTESIGPISRRTLESLGGTEAEYRQNSSEDMLMIANIDAAVAVDPVLAAGFSLNAYPVPANTSLSIDIEAANAGTAQLRVLNAIGQQVWNGTYKTMAPGKHTLQLDAAKWDAGIYFVEMTAGNQRLSQKIVIAR